MDTADEEPGEQTPTPKKRTRGPAPLLETATCAAAIAQLNGNIQAVARKFKVNRSTVTAFINHDPNLQAVLSDAREGMLDDAEGMLFKAVKKCEAWAVCFFLKTQGKSRGYIEKGDDAKKDAEDKPLVVGGAADPDKL